jgi:DNA-binding NarL/FixJ family response regulator
MANRQAAKPFGSILIADDHEVFRFGLAEVLCKALGAARLISVERFDQALEALGEPDLALAIFDLRIPGLEDPRGLTNERKVRPDIRVIVLSGSDARDDMLAALEAGVHGYLVKNEGADKIVARVKYVLSGEVYVPPAIAVLPQAQRNGAGSGDTPAMLLTSRQRQVLELVAEGLSNKSIAHRLRISEGTVKMHVAATFRAIGATNRTQAAATYKLMFG